LIIGVTSYKLKTNLFDRKLIISYEDIHIINPKRAKLFYIQYEFM